ncbi:MAG TPA: glycoside hydrolase family 88 protein [Pyrinomonadaceae bacterium]|nr:glycoside hydrolase family 88 protein [Pyrinomonadaceae bacterium]
MYRQRKPVAFLFAIGIVLIIRPCVLAQSYFRDWPAGTSPQEIGKRVAENFVARKLEFEQGKRPYVIYPEVCAWYGALTVAQLTNDRNLQTRLIQKFDPLLTSDGAKHVSAEPHVDYRVFGVVPLEIYMQTSERKYLDVGKSLADKQWEKTTPDGITSEARYWIDDMYMITAVQVQAFRATHDTKYLDRAAVTMAGYLDKLQQPNGLFFHAPDSPFYWGRGNGWVAAGMTELLRSLPKNHPRRARILDGYRTMMASLLKYQGEDGLWRQLVDHPEVWAETSSTGMFTFAMVTGVKNGWLDRKVYGPAARKAWMGLIKHIDSEANVSDVCIGTNKAAQEVGPNLDTQMKYYFDRARRTGDLHGQTPVLWSATALLR